MKKRSTRLLSLCLAIVLTAGLLAINGFAVSEKKYGVYTAIGDSIPAGYGLDGFDTKSHECWNGGIIADSYPVLLADELDTDVYNPMSRPGFRTVELRALLDDTYSGDEYTTDMLLPTLQISAQEFSAYGAELTEAIKSSDLITLELGSNDIFTYAVMSMEAYIAKQQGVDKTELSEARSYMSNFETLDKAFSKLMDMAKKLNVTAGAVSLFTADMMKGYVNFKINLPKCVKAIYALNPDVELLVVGMYNPFRDVKLTDQSLLKIGSAADQFVGLMNVYMKTLCPYAYKYTYVDVTDAQVYQFSSVVSGEIPNELLKNVHPTVAGHRYIADQIIAALPAGTASNSSSASAAGVATGAVTAVTRLLGARLR